MACRRLLALLAGAAALGFLTDLALAEPPPSASTPKAAPAKWAPTYNADIRPILAERCFTCHGPDEKQRQADLRLDTFAGATADLGGRRAIRSGQPQASELLARVRSEDAALRMPPAEAGPALTEAEIRVLERWIRAGAQYQTHWAFTPPQRPKLPQVTDPAWAANPIDLFVQARLEAAGLQPSPPADKAALLRRVTLDLTGLPPTTKALDAFLADDAPDAYQRAVEKLLASPALGEHLATRWLDAARYADTNGYQSDGDREMWRWRDWVIEAINANMPFDQFTIEQLAGDLLPNATFEQRLATGFNRNHRGNAEGGIIPEEYAVEYVVDRVETTSTVWLGLTLGCARCHDHKYDPISQREFYQLFAFFNNVPENGKAVKFGNSPPMMVAPTRDQQHRLRQLEAHVKACEQAVTQLADRQQQQQRQWEQRIAASGKPVDWTITAGLLGHFPFDGDAANHAPATITRAASAKNDVPEPDKPTAGKNSETSSATVLPRRFGPGPLGQAADFDGREPLDAGNLGHFTYMDKFTISAWIFPVQTTGTIVSKMADTARADGYAVRLEGGRVQVNLVKRWLDDAIRVETTSSLAANRWHHVLVTYDGSRIAAGIQVYFDGQPQPLHVHLDELNQSFENDEPFRIGGGGGSDDRFQGSIDDLRLYDRALDAVEARVVAEPGDLTALAALPADRRTQNQGVKLREAFARVFAEPAIREPYQQWLAARQQVQTYRERLPTVMVMVEMPRPRPTYLLERGQYDQPGERVTADVPGCLPPLPSTASEDGRVPNRLDLARWLTSANHPLTARVTVNRLWEMLFGRGLVDTPEDLGTQGSLPTHPELLDWLAVELVESGWDVKHMLRTIVTSATYQQSSHAGEELWQRDPDNRLLARGPRFRLSAEAVRDQALSAAGLLVQRQGGPSVKPYQPAGLWQDVATISTYEQSHGADLYRRSVYTFFKRTVSPPSMALFDAPGREACSVRRVSTNTPLQALAIMNGKTYLEAARVLAARLMQEEPSLDARLTQAFRRLTSRLPRESELTVLRRGYHRHWQRFAADQQAARQLVQVGEYPLPDGLDPAEHAALTAMVSTILNLDEVITRQ